MVFYRTRDRKGTVGTMAAKLQVSYIYSSQRYDTRVID